MLPCRAPDELGERDLHQILTAEAVGISPSALVWRRRASHGGGLKGPIHRGPGSTKKKVPVGILQGSAQASQATTRKEACGDSGMAEPLSLAKKASRRTRATMVSTKSLRHSRGPSNSFSGARQKRGEPESSYCLSICC
ncbi:hypothetical protein Nepgr_009322 [Nepenthes gracilis]|uniref:Uncharacterized protein n=1 Tax=Nepenthes gracilis TaxID=150966 RepID=A0AAD3XK20_NEPGR|nr:hypothetical protein Nepgr_009322 [Nepenthes gracilis]